MSLLLHSPRLRGRLAIAAAALGLIAFACPRDAEARPGGPTLGNIGNAQPVKNTTPAALEDIGIEDKSGALLPLDLRLLASDGRAVKLGDFVDGERPVLLVLAYYGCPMLCSLVLNGLTDGMKTMGWTAGDQYRVVVVSFDPRDGLEVAREKQAAYVGAYGRSTTAAEGPSGIEFTVGAETEVQRLAETVGFRYRWDPTAEQYAHAAGVFVVTPQGKLATTLTGVKFPGEELQKELVSADQELSHAPLKAVLMRCYVYDSRRGAFVVDPRLLMKLGGGMTILAIASVVWRVARPKKKPRPVSTPMTPPMSHTMSPPTSDDERSPQ